MTRSSKSLLWFLTVLPLVAGPVAANPVRRAVVVKKVFKKVAVAVPVPIALPFAYPIATPTYTASYAAQALHTQASSYSYAAPQVVQQQAVAAVPVCAPVATVAACAPAVGVAYSGQAAYGQAGYAQPQATYQQAQSYGTGAYGGQQAQGYQQAEQPQQFGAVAQQGDLGAILGRIDQRLAVLEERCQVGPPPEPPQAPAPPAQNGNGGQVGFLPLGAGKCVQCHQRGNEGGSRGVVLLERDRLAAISPQRYARLVQHLRNRTMPPQHSGMPPLTDIEAGDWLARAGRVAMAR